MQMLRCAASALCLLAVGWSAAPTARLASRVVFASTRDGNWEIYTADADGGRVARLTTRAEQDRFPLWSPDGTRIAFGSKVGGESGPWDESWALWVMDADGHGARSLCGRIAAKGHREWSPDGTRIALTSTRDGDREIYAVRVDGSAPVRLTTSPGDDDDPSWSPDGARIAFSSTRDGNREIYVMRADGTEPTRLTREAADDGTPVWSPDGAWIAFVSSRDGNRELYRMRPDGSGVERLTNDPAADHVPVWSPDGTRIVFQSTRGENYDVEVVRVADHARTRLTDGPEYDGAAAWSPDGTQLAFVSARGGGNDGIGMLYVVPAAGGTATRVTTHATLNPHWLPARAALKARSDSRPSTP